MKNDKSFYDDLDTYTRLLKQVSSAGDLFTGVYAKRIPGVFSDIIEFNSIVKQLECRLNEVKE